VLAGITPSNAFSTLLLLVSKKVLITANPYSRAVFVWQKAVHQAVGLFSLICFAEKENLALWQDIEGESSF
jgi:hypothetical protein